MISLMLTPFLLALFAGRFPLSSMFPYFSLGASTSVSFVRGSLSFLNFPLMLSFIEFFGEDRK